MKTFFLRAIVQNDVKTSGHGDDQLVQILVCVAATLGAAGNIVDVIDALNLERYMPAALNESKIASRIVDYGKVNEPAFRETHEFCSSAPTCSAPDMNIHQARSNSYES